MGTPAYQLVIDWVEAQIRVGQLKPGDRLPTIVEIAALLEVGQTTVKAALVRLQERGVIRGQQGKGSFVAGSPGA